MCSGLRPPQYALPTPEVSPLEAAPRSLADYHAHYATHVSHAPTLALSPHPHDRFSFESGSLSAGNQCWVLLPTLSSPRLSYTSHYTSGPAPGDHTDHTATSHQNTVFGNMETRQRRRFVRHTALG